MRRFIPAVFLVATIAGPGIASAQGTLDVSFDTSTTGGNYAPKNIVAVWIEDAGGQFVKTIGRWANTRRSHLVAWSTASGQDADAVSGATLQNYQRLSASWDLTDRNGLPVPNGTYTIRMELADRNSNTPDQNNQGTFTFVHDGQPSTQSLTGGGFDNVDVTYAGLDTGLCGNDVLDAGETCDPIDSCPTTCAVASDVCMANVLVGAAATCNAECVEQPIEACVDGDGCCPVGCASATDDDCSSDSPAVGNDPLTGGCEVGGGASSAVSMLLLFGLVCIVRRRRRSAD